MKILVATMIAGIVFADPTSGDPIVDWLTRAGPIGILSFGIIAFFKGWIVTGSSCKAQIEELQAQRDKALELVYKQAEISTRTLEIAKKAGAD